MLSVVVLNFVKLFCYTDCHCADYHYADCHYPDYHYADCHYAECHYGDCCGDNDLARRKLRSQAISGLFISYVYSQDYQMVRGGAAMGTANKKPGKGQILSFGLKL